MKMHNKCMGLEENNNIHDQMRIILKTITDKND